MVKKKKKLTDKFAPAEELEGSASMVNLDGESKAKIPVKVVTTKKSP